MALKTLLMINRMKLDTSLQIAKPKNRAENTRYIVHTLEDVNHGHKNQAFAQPKKSKNDLHKRAKNSYFSKELARHLTVLDSPLNKAYRTTLFDCCSTLMQEGKKITANMYCGYRWCNVCNRIRTGKLLNGYLKPLEQMKEPYFVTVTIPNVTGKELRHSLVGMVQTSANITRVLKRLKMAVNGIRKIECTYNVEQDTYHPHLHFIFDGEAVSKKFIDEWLIRYPHASSSGQDFKPVTNYGGGIKELFKYTTKIVTKTKATGDYNIYVPALDTIFRAMKGMRTFQNFGNIKRVNDEINDLLADDYTDIEPYDFVVWQWERNDWRNMANGNMLTNYKPSKRMIELVTSNVVT